MHTLKKSAIFLLAVFAIFFAQPKARATASLSFLGNIVNAGGSTSVNNNTTASPFTIPIDCQRILLVLPTEAAGFNIHIDQSSTVTATSNDFNQVGPASVQLTLSTPASSNSYVAIFNSGGGGTVKAYCIAGPGTS